MRSLFLVVAAAFTLLALAVVPQAVMSQQATAPAAGQVSAAAPASLIDKGRYLAAAGDCIACHTMPGGAPFAGGLPVATPFGTVLSANLTPDKTGIGDWTADQFYRAMHEGIDDDGEHLYPAFPYNDYTLVTREDSDAIFAYLKSLPPVHHPLDRNHLKFPFSIRGMMAGWNLLFLHKGPYQPNPQKSAEWNRGAYLVEGLGHCEACHTPKNLLGAPKHGDAFEGGKFGLWFAPDLTANRRRGLGGWSREDLVAFLKTGRNQHASASGEMGDVAHYSTSQLTDADLGAIATYLADRPASPDHSFDKPDGAVMRQGEAIWVDTCSACHRVDGSGVPGLFPPMKGDANVQQVDATTVLHFILAGTRATPTHARPTPLSMPAYGWKLDDDQIAAVATYARNAWGNAAPAVRADDVSKLRGQLKRAPVPKQAASAGGMTHPNPLTLAPADTDSRDNGGAQAGRAAAAQDTLGGAAAGASGAASGQGANGSGNGQGATNGGNDKGHPGGVTTGGPG